MNPFIKVTTQNALKERDKEILQFLADGFTVNKIAKKVFLSPRTVQARIGRIKDSVDCKTIAQLVAEGIRHNIIT